MPQQGTDQPQAAKRTTEGSRSGAVSRGKGPSSEQRKAGRPVGSKNKPKSLLPADLALDILGVMRDQLPPDHYAYIEGVIRKGDAIATDKELDVLITLVRASLMPYLIREATVALSVEDGDEEDDTAKVEFPGISRDVTDRLKLLNSLLGLRHQIDKGKDDPKDSDSPILQIFAKRGIDGERLRVLVGVESGPVAGSSDGSGRRALQAGGVSAPVPERPLALPDSEQVEADWVLDDSGLGSSPEDGDD